MTMEQSREEFLEHVRCMVNYWNEQDRDTIKEKLSGLAFSILVALDGCAGDLPAYEVLPINREDENIGEDIAGELHERFYKK